ncbi:hypothetical protein LSAT2_026153, partial [Lamellibrachia satsuma]
ISKATETCKYAFFRTRPCVATDQQPLGNNTVVSCSMGTKFKQMSRLVNQRHPASGHSASRGSPDNLSPPFSREGTACDVTKEQNRAKANKGERHRAQIPSSQPSEHLLSRRQSHATNRPATKSWGKLPGRGTKGRGGRCVDTLG